MSDKASYKFKFTGEISPDVKVEAVKKEMARLFGITTAELEAIFVGDAFFQRTGLNKLTAELYQSKFNKIGAVCYLEQGNESSTHEEQTLATTSNDISTTSLNKNVCPKCQSTNIDSEQCHDCGIYIEKYKTRMSNSIEPGKNKVSEHTSNDDSDDEDYVLIEYKRKAITIIKYSLYYLIAVFTIDSFTDDNRSGLKYILSPDFKVGYIPYLIGNVAMAYGCYYLALLKGRSGLWGLAGLASLPGLCVLLLLKNKNDPRSRIDTKLKIVSYLVIGISGVWMANKISVSGLESEYVEKAQLLREMRNEYPSKQIDSNNRLYQTEITELNDYLDEGFNLLSDSSFNHYQITAVADVMFSETMRLFVWIKYQQYLQFRQGGQGIEFLDRENIRELQKMTFKKIMEQVKKINDTSLSDSFKLWFVGSGESYEEALYFSQFNQTEFKISEKIRELNFLNKLPFDPPEFSLKKIEMPKFPQSIITNLAIDEESEDIVSYTFSDRSYAAAGKTLVFAYYYIVYQKYDVTKRSNVDRYHLRKVQISPDFPANLIQGDSAVFEGADIFPLFDQHMRR